MNTTTSRATERLLELLTKTHEAGVPIEAKVIRRVRTPAGERRFGQPIGSIIVRDSLLRNLKISLSPSEFGGFDKVDGSNGKTYYVGQYDGESGYVAVDDKDKVIYDGDDLEEAWTTLDAHVSKGSARVRLSAREKADLKNWNEADLNTYHGYRNDGRRHGDAMEETIKGNMSASEKRGAGSLAAEDSDVYWESRYQGASHREAMDLADKHEWLREEISELEKRDIPFKYPKPNRNLSERERLARLEDAVKKVKEPAAKKAPRVKMRMPSSKTPTRERSAARKEPVSDSLDRRLTTEEWRESRRAATESLKRKPEARALYDDIYEGIHKMNRLGIMDTRYSPEERNRRKVVAIRNKIRKAAATLPPAAYENLAREFNSELLGAQRGIRDNPAFRLGEAKALVEYANSYDQTAMYTSFDKAVEAKDATAIQVYGRRIIAEAKANGARPEVIPLVENYLEG